VFSAAGARAKRVWSILNEASMHLSDTDSISVTDRIILLFSQGHLLGSYVVVHIFTSVLQFLQQPDDDPNRDRNMCISHNKYTAVLASKFEKTQRDENH